MRLDLGSAAVIVAVADAALCVVYGVLVEIRERRRRRKLDQAIKDAMQTANEQTDEYLVSYSYGEADAYARIKKLFFGDLK